MRVAGGLGRMLVFALPLTFLTFLLVSAWLYVDGTAAITKLVDRASRQRMLARDIVAHAQGVALGSNQRKVALRESIGLIKTDLRGLEHGGIWHGDEVPAAPEQARQAIESARAYLANIGAAIEQLSDAARVDDALVAIQVESNQLVAAADEIVEVIENHGSERRVRLLWILTAAIGANLFLLVFSLWYARRDARQQRNAVESLLESEERFRQLAEHIDEAFWICSADGKDVVYVSPAYETIWGRSRESLYEQPMNWTGAIHPSDQKRVHDAFLANVNFGTFDETYRIVRPDGTVRWIRDRGFPIRDASGEVVRVAGIAADVTDLKAVSEEVVRTQDQLQIQTSALNLKELQLRAVVEHLPDGVCLLGPGREVLLTNEVGAAYIERLGGGTGDGPLSRLGELDIAEMLIAADAGRPHEIVHTESGSVYVASAVPLAGGAEGWVLVVRDVSVERANQEQQQQQEHLASVGQLAAGIAHDFNNLLTVMMGTAQMLERSGRLEPQELEHLRQISVQGERATRLVDQILDFSRATAVERKPLDLVPFLGQMVRMVRRILPETITIDDDIQVERCVVEANLSQLQQALTNLVANARDAMRDGGTLRIVLSDVRVTASSNLPVVGLPLGEYAVWTISDTGRGMAPDVVAHVFEPFFTTKKPGQGTGLGLAQLYGIVMQHGGQVDVVSEVERGTTFTIYLPKSVHEQAEEEEPEHGMPMGHHETVLLVEDEIPVRDAVQAMLEALDYVVVAASDGREALSVFGGRKGTIDAVLTDIVMPEMGGLELWAALRVRDEGVPVIAMSGYPLGTFEGDADGSTLPEEIAGYLKKPVALRQLAQALQRALHPGVN